MNPTSAEFSSADEEKLLDLPKIRGRGRFLLPRIEKGDTPTYYRNCKKPGLFSKMRISRSVPLIFKNDGVRSKLVSGRCLGY
jgi:hypothetical protein